MALLEPGEAADAYKENLLRYQAGADCLALQTAAPEKLASLTGGLSAEELTRRTLRYCARLLLRSGICTGFTPNAVLSPSVTSRCTTLATTSITSNKSRPSGSSRSVRLTIDARGSRHTRPLSTPHRQR